MKKLFQYILSVLKIVPGLRKPLKSIELMKRIERLEKNNQFDEARQFRKKAILQTPFKYRAPLLKSEGEDQLYRLNDYQEALKIFEEAIDALKRCPALFGASAPDRIYAGAAIASIYTQQKVKAAKYYSEFNYFLDEFKNSSISKKSLKWHFETKSWLESQLLENNETPN